MLITALLSSFNVPNGPLIIFNFSKSADLSSWYVMDDVVMGGRSNGQMFLNQEGHGVFHGEVSLENNGGFSSVRCRTAKLNVEGYRSCKLRVRGDGKRYQFRVKAKATDRYSYINYFDTSGEWETVTIDLSELYPSFRGRRLAIDNYAAEELEEISILIANKVAETFRLEIDWIQFE